MLLIIIISLLAIAISLWVRHTLRHSQLRESLTFSDGDSQRLRISVVVTHPQSVNHVASFLNSESTSYQVIIISDFSRNEHLLHEIIAYFGLFRANYTSDNDELPRGAIRSLLRSHRRLFSKIVVVDSPSSGEYTPFEVGAVVSSYNYNLQIDSPKRLRPRAIENLLLELAIRPEGSIEKISSAIGERVRLLYREAALPEGINKIEVKASRHRKINYRLLK